MEWEMKNRVQGRRVIVAALAACLALVTISSPVAARSPEPVTIVSHMSFTFPNVGTFEASGSDLICDSGTVLDLGYVFGGFESGRKVQIRVYKEFTCADGSGTVFVNIQVHANVDGTETFNWVINGGTAAYAGLRGSGHGTTVPDPDRNGNTNYYDGILVG
jgi:hypothetical protein